MTGMRFHFPPNAGISIDDRITVKFFLDEPRKRIFKKKFKSSTLLMANREVKFLNLATEEKRLGYNLFLLRRETPLALLETGRARNLMLLRN